MRIDLTVNFIDIAYYEMENPSESPIFLMGHPILFYIILENKFLFPHFGSFAAPF